MTLSDQDRAKRAAAEAAAGLVEDGMLIGIGSGSTLKIFVECLGARVAAGLRVRGVPTSEVTRAAAEAAGIPLTTLDDVAALDLAIDGADEIDAAGRMIKGGGGFLLREKIVATAAPRYLAVVDASKIVPQLGRFPLPVEVVRFGLRSTWRQVRELLAESGYPEAEIVLRGGEAAPFATDTGNVILDCHLGAITHPEPLAIALNRIAGVSENGLFLGIATEAVVAELGKPVRRVSYAEV